MVSKNVTWAQKIYPILTVQAKNRSKTTYGELLELLDHPGKTNALFQPLQMLHEWCVIHDNPPITALVVKKNTGEVGDWLLARVPDPVAARDKVFVYPWDPVLPKSSELESIKSGLKA